MTSTSQNLRQPNLAWQADLHDNLMTLNMGPQHPATHGVLQVILTLDGEEVVKAEPVIGYLHRGKEKMAESLTFHQWIVHADRLDYLASTQNTLGYCQAVEKLAGIEVPPRAQYLRVILFELSRIFSHLVFVGCGALDLGAATVFFHAWREREKVYDIFDQITGLRMNNGFARIGGVQADLNAEGVAKLRAFTDDFSDRIDGYEYLLTKNRLWWQRTRGVGTITADQAVSMGFSGPNLRASGVARDLRVHEPYAAYSAMDFEIPVGTQGDCYDRYMVRVEELRQANRIIQQALAKLPAGEIYAENRKYVLPPKERVLTYHDKEGVDPAEASMEELIHQFKVVTDAKMPAGEIYHATEAAKGELGFFLASDGTSKPTRLRVRSPSFNNLQVLGKVAPGHLISDLVAIIASLDFVMGEVDR